MIPHRIRPGKPDDLPFVVDSWAKHGRARNERIRDATARVRSILARPDSLLRIACLPDDEDAILGWAVTSAEPPCTHYVYVRKDARGHDIERSLVREN